MLSIFTPLCGTQLVQLSTVQPAPQESPTHSFLSCFLLQDVALIDARRGANMFRKIKVPLLGIVENMSHYQCPACGHKEHIFGHEGALRTAETMKMDVLGQVRLLHLSLYYQLDGNTVSNTDRCC